MRTENGGFFMLEIPFLHNPLTHNRASAGNGPALRSFWAGGEARIWLCFPTPNGIIIGIGDASGLPCVCRKRSLWLRCCVALLYIQRACVCASSICRRFALQNLRAQAKRTFLRQDQRTQKYWKYFKDANAGPREKSPGRSVGWAGCIAYGGTPPERE